MLKSKVQNDDLNNSQSEKPGEYFIYETIKCLHKQCQVPSILKNVNQWDYDGYSQMRYISYFICYECDFGVNDYKFWKEWKEHIMSIKHISKCRNVGYLYSYACGACRILLYGSMEKIRQHRFSMHCDKSALPVVSLLMAKLMEEPDTHWYFCTHCKIFSKTEIHPFVINHYTNKTLYNCKYCNVTFLCSDEVLDCHSLSLEHVTLKCIYFIKKAIEEEKNSKNQVAKIKKCVPSIKLNLPLIILNRFQNTSPSIAKCKLCYIVIDWSTENIIQHMLNVCIKPNDIPTNFNHTCATIKFYSCEVCNWAEYSFPNYVNHVISVTHLTKCLINDDLYSYFCNKCNLYIYGTEQSIVDHWKKIHDGGSYELPYRSKFLAVNYKNISNYPYGKSMKLYYNQPVEKSEENQCDVCKIDFGKHLCDFNYHKISSEHIILKYFTLNNTLLNTEIHDKPSKHTSLMNTNSTVDKEILDHTIDQSSENINENLQEEKKSEVKLEYARKNETIFNSTILKNLEHYDNDNSIIFHPAKRSSVSSPSEVSIVSGNNNTNSDVYNNKNSSTEALMENTQDPTIYLDISIDSENSNSSVMVFDADFKSPAEFVTELTQDTVKYLDVSTNTENSNPQVMACGKNDINQEPPTDSIDTDIGNKSDHIKIPANNISITMLNETLSNIIKLHDQLQPIDMDEAYGQYVAQRLKSIQNESVKSEIKLEIDFLFCKMIQSIKDSVEK